MKIKSEIATVRICYGHGIVFSIDVLAEIGVSDERLKEEAIKHFKMYMPSQEQVLKIDEYLQDQKAWIQVEHEELSQETN